MRAFYLKYNALFYYLLLLTTVFLLAEISFFIQCTQIYFHDFYFISHHIAIPKAIIPGVVFFIFAQLLLHFSYCLFLGMAAIALASLFRFSSEMLIKTALGLWLFGIASIFIANQYLFPNSKFAELSGILIPEVLLPYLFILLVFVWLGIMLVTVYALLISLSRRWLLGFMTATLCLSAYLGYQAYFFVTEDAGTLERPNIIIIGVDSLRPDFLGFFGAKNNTRFFNAFLQQATVFSKTFTPIARTFPSWMSILTGKYPKESGVRFNLASEAVTTKAPLLSNILQKEGYRTIFATDESQFSNIDRSYGFDEAVTPLMGLNDFLLGTFNDFPLSNLVINTMVGQWLFPHSYANRPSFMTYNPDSFLARLKPYLKQSRKRPLFLSVHFCLTHYPYLWASRNGNHDKDPVSRYQESVLRVDQQLSDFMAMLERYQVLRHAIVVLLSDHGEAFELKGDRITAPSAYIPLREGKTKTIPRFYPPSVDSEAVNQSVGHGTDVLGFSQYHSLMAFHLYGLGPQSLRIIPNYTLLMDIKPTVLDFIKVQDQSSGVSLRGVILGQKLFPKRRSFFFESDYSPEAVRSVHPETRNLVFEGIDLFTIDPHTTRIYVKEAMGKLIISSKQYATIDDGWVLALYPRGHGKMTPVLVQLSTGEWTTDLNTAFAERSPQQRMLQALKKFYGKEIKQLASLN